MPHVASQATTHAHKPKLPNPARNAQASDRSGGSNFASLLDGTPTAEDTRQAVPAKPQAPAEKAKAPEQKTDCKDAKQSREGETEKCAAEAEATEQQGTDKPIAPEAPVVEAATQDGQKTAETAPDKDGHKDDVQVTVALSETPVETQAPTPAAAPMPAVVSAPHPAPASGKPEPVVDRVTLPDTAPDTGALGTSLNAEFKAAVAQAVDAKEKPSAEIDKPTDINASAKAPGNAHHEATAPAAVSTDLQAAAPKAQDAAQPSFTPAVHHDAAPAQGPAPAAPAAQTPPAMVPVAGLAIEIAGKAMAGKNRFEIRLDPPELGRIEVRLDVDRDGKVSSRLVVDRPETYDLLRRDASGLERALQDAGLKTADNGLQFSLRDQGNMAREQTYVPSPAAAQVVVQDDTLPADTNPTSYVRAGLGRGIDIRV